jgi:radical SAM superfamily enzyme YgiQ (UPF0313 family)
MSTDLKRASKALLVYPKVGLNSVVWDMASRMEPLALEYVAAALPLAEVRIQDMRIEPDLIRTIMEYAPDIVGFTGLSCHVNNIIALARLVKSINGSVVVIVGGHHATVSPCDFDLPEVDFIVSGEGCSAVKELFECGGQYEKVPGLGHCMNGKRIYNEPRPHPSLDSLPLPRRDLTLRYRGKYLVNWLDKIAMIRTSVGCPFRCSFCALWNINGGKYLKRDVGKVVAELGSLDAEYIFFADDETMIDYNRMMDMARRIQEAGIKKQYYLFARADTVVKHPDLFEKWKEIGLDIVLVGYESFSDQRLDNFNKNVKIEIQEKATAILHGLGLRIDPQFIVEPEYGESDFKALRAYIRKNRLWQPSFGILTPLPGTEIYSKRRHETTTANWDFYDGWHLVLPTNLPQPQFYRLFRWLEATATPWEYKIRNLFKQPLKTLILSLYSVLAFRLQLAKHYQQVSEYPENKIVKQ